MKIAILKATNEFIILTGDTVKVAGKTRYQIERRHRNAYDLPTPYYKEFVTESQFVVWNKNSVR